MNRRYLTCLLFLFILSFAASTLAREQNQNDLAPGQNLSYSASSESRGAAQHRRGGRQTGLAAGGGPAITGSSTISATNHAFFPIILKWDDPSTYDMVRFLVGDARLYEVQHSSGSQARHQTQVEESRFFHTKGNEISAEWEELWYTERYIYRGTDTSPGDGRYYTLRDPGIYGSAWAPRFWSPGEVFERYPLVTFYWKSDCSSYISGYQRSWLLFEDYYSQYTFESGITLNDVVQLAWLDKPEGAPLERYYYAEEYGLVAWWSSNNGWSYVSEIHEPGTRPDNTREIIPCLDRSPVVMPAPSHKLPFWPGEHRR